MKTRSAGWIGGTAVLIVAILAATYMFLYQPRVEEAAETLAMAEETTSRNEILQITVNGLAAEAERVPTYRAAIGEVAGQLPPVADLAPVTKLINDTATATSVLITELSPGGAMDVIMPTVVAPPVPVEPEEEGEEGDAAVDAAEETAEEAEDAADERDDTEPEQPAAPAVPTQVEGFVAVPVLVKVLGTHANVVAFLDSLQRQEGRLFLATDIDAVRQIEAEATNGKPPTVDGDVELTVNGYFWVLEDIGNLPPEEGAEPDPEEPVDPEEQVDPVFPPFNPKNPFVPLVPSRQD